jgi:hypothetical protein
VLTQPADGVGPSTWLRGWDLTELRSIRHNAPDVPPRPVPSMSPNPESR